MNEPFLSSIDASLTNETSHETNTARPPSVRPEADTCAKVHHSDSSSGLPHREVLVLARKARTIQGRETDQAARSSPLSDNSCAKDTNDQWILRLVLSRAAACLVIADRLSTARMAASLLSECCAHRKQIAGLLAVREVSQFHVATTRMNAVDQSVFDQLRDPEIRTYSKNYANGRAPHMPIRTAGFASRIREDFDAALNRGAEPLLQAARLVVLHVPSQELLGDAQGLHAFLDEIVEDVTAVALVAVGYVDPARLATGVFDSILYVRAYEGDEEGQSFTLSLHESQYLSQRAFPPQIVARATSGLWTSKTYISDDADIRDMVARCSAGESLAAIGETYGISKGQVSKLMKPFRVRGLLKTAV